MFLISGCPKACVLINFVLIKKKTCMTFVISGAISFIDLYVVFFLFFVCFCFYIRRKTNKKIVNKRYKNEIYIKHGRLFINKGILQCKHIKQWPAQGTIVMSWRTIQNKTHYMGHIFQIKWYYTFQLQEHTYFYDEWIVNCILIKLLR